MRRKTWLAWLALLGLGPSLALAQATTASGLGGAAPAAEEVHVKNDAEDEWTSLKDDSAAKPVVGQAPAKVAAPASAHPTHGAPAVRPSEASANVPKAVMGKVASSSSAGVSNGMVSHAADRTMNVAGMNAGACDRCYGLGCDACGPCGDVCCDSGAGGLGMGLRRWSDPCLWGMWVDVDYLYWRLDGNTVPPLVSTAPNGVVPSLNQPGAVVAFGASDLDDDFRSGGRIRFGNWIDDTQSIGVEGHFFTLANTSTNVTFSQAPAEGFTSIGVPFIAINPPPPLVGPIESSFVVALDQPGAGFANVGAVNVLTSSDVYSAGGLIRHFVAEDAGVRMDAIAGYRFFRMDEGLTLSATTTIGTNFPAVIPPAPGTVISFRDAFDVENEFHGGELGLVVERDYGDFLSVEMTGKIALGSNHQTVRLEGVNSVGAPGFPTVFTPGGLLVQPTNTGSPMARGAYERDEFAILPEVNIKVGLQLTRQTRLTAGWSVLYMDSVVRSGGQIDRTVNATQIGGGALVGPARPAFNFNDDDMWLYGASFGLESTF